MEGIKLAAMGGSRFYSIQYLRNQLLKNIFISSKRDYLSFDCAMKEKGQVRLKVKNVMKGTIVVVADSILVGTVW